MPTAALQPQVTYTIPLGTYSVRRRNPARHRTQVPLFTRADYYATSDDERIELICGRFVEMASPNRIHQEISAELTRLMRNFIIEHNLSCRAYAGPFDVEPVPGEDTVVVPDLAVICDAGKLDEHGCKGAPDWVVEIASPSDLARDYVVKQQLYDRAGVSEYWIVNPMTRQTQVSILDGTDSVTHIYSFDEPVPSLTLEGLTIDFSAMSLD